MSGSKFQVNFLPDDLRINVDPDTAAPVERLLSQFKPIFSGKRAQLEPPVIGAAVLDPQFIETLVMMPHVEGAAGLEPQVIGASILKSRVI